MSLGIKMWGPFREVILPLVEPIASYCLMIGLQLGAMSPLFPWGFRPWRIWGLVALVICSKRWTYMLTRNLQKLFGKDDPQRSLHVSIQPK
jgi:choline-glycine betaine transporter